MRKKWLSYMGQGSAAVFILYIIPMFFPSLFFPYFRKDIYVLIGVLLSFLLYLFMWRDFSRMREEGVIPKDAKFSFISNLLFFTFFLSIPLLSPYQEAESSCVPSLLLYFLVLVFLSDSLSIRFGPVKGHLIPIIISCSIFPILAQAGLKVIMILLFLLAYFIASILDIRRNRFPYFVLAYLMRENILRTSANAV